jgi:hypothetical protein
MIDKNSGNVEDVSKQTSQTEQVNFKEHFRTKDINFGENKDKLELHQNIELSVKYHKD